jgi:hypothetical protein
MGVSIVPGHGSGTRTATNSPRRSSLASRSASRRSVLTLSPEARGIFDGAATVHRPRIAERS